MNSIPPNTRVLIIEQGYGNFNCTGTTMEEEALIPCRCGRTHLIQPVLVDGKGDDLFKVQDLIPLTDPDNDLKVERVKELEEHFL